MRKTYSTAILIAISLAPVVYILGSSSSVWFEQNHNAQQSVALEVYLREIGNRYNCHFTLELIVGSDVEKQRFHADSKAKSLKGELDFLQMRFPQLAFKFVNEPTRIIHLIDKRLQKGQDYALDKVVHWIEFEGSVFDFVEAIGKQGINITSKGMVDIHENGLTDFSTRVRLSEEGKTVRTLLSDSVVIEGRSRILWTAKTKLEDKPITFVRFLK